MQAGIKLEERGIGMTKDKRTKTKTKKNENLPKSNCADEEQTRFGQSRGLPKKGPGKFKLVENSDDTTLPLSLEDVDVNELRKSFGTADPQFQAYLLTHVVRSFEAVLNRKGYDKQKYTEACNIVLSILHGIKPRDEVETMLIMQMIGVHNLAMLSLGGSIIGDQPADGRVHLVNQSAKMLRTFTSQMEALKKYRTGGQQKVTVEHVNVNEGGPVKKTKNEPHAKRSGWLKNGNPPGDFTKAPRCCAKTRKGTPCKAPAMANGRCRLHGGKSTGPKTPEGLERSKRANWRHGFYSVEAVEGRRFICSLLRESKDFVNRLTAQGG